MSLFYPNAYIIAYYPILATSILTEDGRIKGSMYHTDGDVFAFLTFLCLVFFHIGKNFILREVEKLLHVN